MTARFHLLAAGMLTTLWLLGASTCWAVPDPTNESAFTAHVAERIKKEIPAADVTVKAVRTIDVKIQGRSLTVSLDNLAADCASEPKECEHYVDRFVSVTQAASRADDAPFKKEDVRLVVRNSQYMREATAKQVPGSKRAPIMERLIGDLWLVCVVDQPQHTMTLNLERAAAIGLSKDQAIALGKSNLKASLRSFASVTRDELTDGLGLIDGDFFESSRWLLHDEWEPLSKKYNGNLMVALPANDMILYGNGSTPEKKAAFAALAERTFEKAQRPLSSKVFHWKEGGWELYQ